MNRSDRLVIQVAAGALKAGTDPQIIRQFLERVLESDDEARIETSEDFWAALDRAETNRPSQTLASEDMTE